MQRVLIAVDDLLFGSAIADFVSHHDWGLDAVFLVLHVVQPLPTTEAPLGFLEEAMEEDMAQARDLVMRIAADINASFNRARFVDSKVEWGTPKDKILEVAAEWKANVIVMGSHGRHGLNRLIMGSVSMAVMSHAHCSVVVVRLPTEEAKQV